MNFKVLGLVTLSVQYWILNSLRCLCLNDRQPANVFKLINDRQFIIFSDLSSRNYSPNFKLYKLSEGMGSVSSSANGSWLAVCLLRLHIVVERHVS